MLKISYLSVLLTIVLLLSGCKDVTEKLPSGSVDPKYYMSVEAAEQIAKGARYELQPALLAYMRESGLVADELYMSRAMGTIRGQFDWALLLDQRHLPETFNTADPLLAMVNDLKSYKGLQKVRSRTRLARLTLNATARDSLNELKSEMLLYEAFAQILLADLYCSGTPLSLIELNTDYTYRPGSPTIEIYRNSLTLLDSASGIIEPGSSLESVINIVAARGLLQLGRLTEAAERVRNVPVGFIYDIPILFSGATSVTGNGYIWNQLNRWDSSAVANGKGGNGMPFVSANDPRIVLDSTKRDSPLAPRGNLQLLIYLPKARTRLTIASHIEARLIEAEVFAASGDPAFLDMLNQLRTSGNIVVQQQDSIYEAGTGGVAGLPPLLDPASQTLPSGKTVRDVRLDLVMRERAFWLFFTGQRQGDLRRLIRIYGRTVQETYPTGLYPTASAPLNAGLGRFDDYVDVPIPTDERYNPLFTGCIGRGD